MAGREDGLFALSILFLWIVNFNVQGFPLARSSTFRRYAGMVDISTKAMPLPWYVMEFKGDDALKVNRMISDSVKTGILHNWLRGSVSARFNNWGFPLFFASKAFLCRCSQQQGTTLLSFSYVI